MGLERFNYFRSDCVRRCSKVSAFVRLARGSGQVCLAGGDAAGGGKGTRARIPIRLSRCFRLSSLSARRPSPRDGLAARLGGPGRGGARTPGRRPRGRSRKAPAGRDVAARPTSPGPATGWTGRGNGGRAGTGHFGDLARDLAGVAVTRGFRRARASF